MVSRPPSGIASRALIAALSRAVSSWVGSTSTGHSDGREVELDLDLAAERPRQHLGEGVEPQVEVDHLGLERLAPAEGEQMAGQGRGAVGGFDDRVEIALALRLGLRPPRRSRSAEPRITVIRLLKSWAMPPVSSPSACSFCDWNKSRARLLQLLLGLAALGDVAGDLGEADMAARHRRGSDR